MGTGALNVQDHTKSYFNGNLAPVYFDAGFTERLVNAVFPVHRRQMVIGIHLRVADHRVLTITQAASIVAVLSLTRHKGLVGGYSSPDSNHSDHPDGYNRSNQSNHPDSAHISISVRKLSEV